MPDDVVGRACIENCYSYFRIELLQKLLQISSFGADCIGNMDYIICWLD